MAESDPKKEEDWRVKAAKGWEELNKAYNVPEGEFSVYGTVHTHPEHADAVHAIYEQTTRRAQSSAEPDVIHYCITRDPENPSIFHFFERYRNKEAFRVHNEQEIIQRLVGSGWIRDVEAVFGVPIG